MPADATQTESLLVTLLTIAWLLPLAGFVVEIFARRWAGVTAKWPGFLATVCIAGSFALSVSAYQVWSSATAPVVSTFIETPDDVTADDHEQHGKHPHAMFERAFTGSYFTLGKFGQLNFELNWYVDSLTLLMFVMVSLIATCIHLFALGYMSGELTENYEDHAVETESGQHLQRSGRFHRFFAFLSLFCFSMLGLILAGNLFQVFVFWELVGISSYLLIGFYTERRTANIAANKAFIMNRVGDFGFLIGLMILVTQLGTLHFATLNQGDRPAGVQASDAAAVTQPGLFQILWSTTGELTVETEAGERHIVLHNQQENQPRTISYWLLTLAGLGIFAGCVGKSAQFPLQTWLPDAMEGPTPVSALVHSATMVAAGVYLAGRFYPLFTPDALLVVAYVGCITLFIGATIAVVATDIKRVLAFSTISQLGYMMLAIGVGGWMAAIFHLITHAFFKSLLFLCSGSVIHGCHHEQDMTKMGGLAKKMPITCWTMFIGVVAICGLAVPFLPPLPVIGKVAFSGYHSKDSILATALAFATNNPSHILLFLIPLLSAGLTAFYMFRLWFMTFFGVARDEEIQKHAHESPRIMTVPLIVLAFFAIGVGVGGEAGPLVQQLTQSEPPLMTAGVSSSWTEIKFPTHADIDLQHSKAGAAALVVAFAGMLLAYLFYVTNLVDVAGLKKHFAWLHKFFANGWGFDALYHGLFVVPFRRVAVFCDQFDRIVVEGILRKLTLLSLAFAKLDRAVDETVVDGAVNAVGSSTYHAGRFARTLQTGKLRQYVTWIVLSVLVIFLLLFSLIPGR